MARDDSIHTQRSVGGEVMSEAGGGGEGLRLVSLLRCVQPAILRQQVSWIPVTMALHICREKHHVPVSKGWAPLTDEPALLFE